MYHPPVLPSGQTPTESWVELFNRSANAVDLTGWALQGTIQFGFPPGTVLAAGGYLVVAKDVAYVQTNYPGITVLGPFQNKLPHKSALLLLTDAAGNPANQVCYFDGGRWPGYADGGGSSLELRDPWADNSAAEAWAASDQSKSCPWSNYSYRAVATTVQGPAQWNEFVIGLLDAGECLLDDLHVVESPDTTPVEMLQNGTFETGMTAWRALGDHRHTRVEVDPDNPSNHVLHLISTGPTDHMHNHLETTYAGGRVVTDGRTYQISFRAKWLAGNNHLNTRLYFNRVARTTSLPMPLLHGTPGAPNSTYATNIGPTFTALGHSPIIPQPNSPVTISASAADPQGIKALTLWWSANGGAWQSAPMLAQGPSATLGYANYSGTIPGGSAGDAVQFYVQATDGLGAVSTFPALGPGSRALYKVDQAEPLMNQLHRLRLWMTAADANFLHAHTNVMSDEYLGCTIVYDESQVFYDAGVHLQASERGRDDPSRVGFTLKFNPEQPFRGTQGRIVLDRSGGYSGLGGTHDEILLWHAMNHAGGGLLGVECDLVQLFASKSELDGTGLMRKADFDTEYFDGQFKNGGNGNLYKLELFYYPTTTVTGDPQAWKLPQPDNVENVDIQDLGTNKEYYRWDFVQMNNADADDYSQVVALNHAFSLTGSSLVAQTTQLMDLDEWMRALAFKEFTGDADTYTHGLNHNFKIYFRPEDGKALGLLWDQDFAFVQDLSTSFPQGSSPNTYKIITLPGNYRIYYSHLLDLMTTTVNSAHLTPWATRYAGLLGQDWSGAVNYLQQRANFIRSKLPLANPFAITSNGGKGFATTSSTVTLTGTAPLTVQGISINGQAYPVTWTSLTAWSLAVPLPAYTNLLVAQGLDKYNGLLTNAPASILITNLNPITHKTVLINEWMAESAAPGGLPDPADGSAQGWLELYNPNDSAVDLSGCFLSDSPTQPGKWPFPAGALIQPRGFLLIWADNQTSLNGSDTNGDLHANFILNRLGQTLGLYASDLTPLHTVTFGPQLQNVSQGLFPDGNTNALFFMSDWTPRAPNRLGAPAAPQVCGLVVQPNGAIAFQAAVIPGRTYRVDFKDDLAAPAWTPLGTNLTATAPSLTIQDPLAPPPHRFYRLVLLQ